jgi:uncharacterized protein (TIGR02118 family)
MAIEKHVVLIESRDDEPARAVAESVARQIAERGRATAASGGGVVGLVVDTITEPLTGSPRALAVMQAWIDPDAGASAEQVDALVADPAVETSAWRVDEIVFREPTERQAPPAPHDRVNMIGTAFRRDDFTVDAFFDYWVNTHAHISGRVPGATGYVVSRVRDAHGARAGLGTDAFIELWYPDRATFDAAGATPEQDAAWADVQNYAKTTGEFWLTREDVVIPPPPTGPGTLEQAL